MATAKARTAIVPLRNPYDLDEQVNAEVELLEASGFVAQMVQFVETSDEHGMPAKVALIHCVHQNYAGVGMLTADAAGRARMAAGYFGTGVAASAAHFEDGFWTNSLVGKFADGLFAAADASRNKFVAGFFGITATALALFADGFWVATTAARNKFADLFMTDAKLAQDRGKTAGLMLGGITPSTDISGGAATRALRVNLDGAGLSNVQITAAGLNTGVLIAAALQVAIRAVGGGGYALAEVRFDAASGRYLVASGTRGALSSVATATGLADDVGAVLCLLTANGSVAVPGTDNLDHARGQGALVLGAQVVDTAHVKDGAFPDSATGRLKFGDRIWTEAKLALDVLLTRAQLLMDIATPPTAAAGKGVVLGVGAECLVAPLAAPAMAVRIVTGGTAISHRGRKTAVPTVANLVVDIANGADPRWDLVYSTDADPGVVTYVAGTAAAAPADPALPAGAIPLARLVVPAMAGTINLGAAGSGWCVDLRQRQAAHLPMPAQSVGLPGGSTDISAGGANLNLNVNVNGAGAINLLIANPAAFSIGGAAAVALNTADRIVAALNQLAAQSVQACEFSYDVTSTRYYCTTRLLGGAATVAITAGAGNDLAVLLLLGIAAGGEEHGGTERLSTALVRAAANIEPRSVDNAAVADASLAQVKMAWQPVSDPGRLGCGYARFAVAVNAADTINSTAAEQWTAVAGAPATAWEWTLTAAPAGDTAAFVARVNANAAGLVWAINIGGNAAALIAKVPATVVALAESTAGARTIVGTSIAAEVAADKVLSQTPPYTVTAGDVINLAAGEEIVLGSFPAAAAPRKIALTRENAAGIEFGVLGLSCIARVDTAGFYAVCVADAGAILAQNDVLRSSWMI